MNLENYLHFLFQGKVTSASILLKLYIVLQIQAAVVALRNTRGLPWPKEYKKKKDEDVLDWLQSMFGFQVM